MIYLLDIITEAKGIIEYIDAGCNIYNHAVWSE